MIGKNAGTTMDQPQVYTDLSSLQKINAQGHKDKGAALQSIAKQFESMMVQQMMKSMRQANEAFADGDLTASSEGKFYQDMFDSQLSLSLSQGRGFGLAEAMMRQFHGKLATAVADSKGAAADNKNAGVDGALKNNLSNVTRQQMSMALGVSGDAESGAAFTEQVYRLFQDEDAHKESASTPVDASALDGTPENFVKVLRPAAERIAKQLGIDSRVLLSQAALETGWGQKVIQRSGGASSFNFFNIKAGSDWQGATVSVPTIEYQNGVAVRELASFRAYRSPEESFSDYANLIAGNPRYQQALQHGGNATTYIKALAAAGYATDPRYADKVLALFNGDQINGPQITTEKNSNGKLNGDRLDGVAKQVNFSETSDFSEFEQL
ncbi:MAG TPA: flagellar assembly peptidoglycan hydrolase FlgJ [Spongiibacteraceae bacterium]|nr:flagellar assembly peptidoglycan hydrolase FlgJ [Spongiibacteraceae bacterium]